VAPDERVGLAVTPVLPRVGFGIYRVQHVFFLAYSGAGVVDHDATARTPKEVILPSVSLRVEERQVTSSAELAIHDPEAVASLAGIPLVVLVMF